MEDPRELCRVRLPENDLPATEISYLDLGTGPVVLLVHGFPLDHTMWNAQIEALSKQYRVIAPDLRGFGKTELGPIDLTLGVSMAQYAEDLVGFLEAIKVTEKIVYCGFSMGGYLGWPFIEKHQDRLRGLICCDTRAVKDTEEARLGRIKIAENIEAWGSARLAAMMSPKLFSPYTIASRSALVKKTVQVIRNTEEASIGAASRGMAARFDQTKLLKKIKVPTLVLCGAGDKISPPDEMREIAEAIPTAKFRLISSAGHMTPVENPEAVNREIIGFLETLA